MPRKKRQTYDDKRKNVIAKLVFVSVIFALILLANLVMSLRPQSKQVKPDQNTSSSESGESNETGLSSENGDVAGVLGEHIINEDNISESVGKTLDAAKKQAQTTQDQLKGVSEKAIESGKIQAEKSISSFVYESTLKPIVEKIHNLPEEQQNAIKKAVCE